MPPKSKKSNKPKFQRATPRRDAESTDDVGKVFVKIDLECPERGGHRHKKGNIIRTITIKDAKVSDVADAIDAALFPEDQ